MSGRGKRQEERKQKWLLRACVVAPNKVAASQRVDKTESATPDYKQIHQRFQIICNNSVNGGDCYGDTMCICKCFLYDKRFDQFYKTKPTSLHHDFLCLECQMRICGCCYSDQVCPVCKGTRHEELPH